MWRSWMKCRKRPSKKRDHKKEHQHGAIFYAVDCEPSFPVVESDPPVTIMKMVFWRQLKALQTTQQLNDILRVPIQ